MLGTFLFGAIGYPALELLTRGRTHYSMALAGGASAVLIGRIRAIRAPLGIRALMSAAGITGIEYACGCIWNREHRVWDYRRMPLNCRGQICLPYSALWFCLSAGMLAAMDRLYGQSNRPGS
ncbi:MAG: hypothetical protein E7327_03115 [Clostridiales bacterium]|nr:hypothetical protein [Clostridiales bacterium]